MRALHIYAGPTARQLIARHGLQPQDIGTLPGAAGGPKGLVLGPLDRFIFGQWLPRSSQPVHLVGASIGAAPNPDWVKTLPHGKLPDRADFTHYSHDLAGRVKAWGAVTSASARLADEFEAWLRQPDVGRVQAL